MKGISCLPGGGCWAFCRGLLSGCVVSSRYIVRRPAPPQYESDGLTFRPNVPPDGRTSCPRSISTAAFSRRSQTFAAPSVSGGTFARPCTPICRYGHRTTQSSRKGITRDRIRTARSTRTCQWTAPDSSSSNSGPSMYNAGTAGARLLSRTMRSCRPSCTRQDSPNSKLSPSSLHLSAGCTCRRPQLTRIQNGSTRGWPPHPRLMLHNPTVNKYPGPLQRGAAVHPFTYARLAGTPSRPHVSDKTLSQPPFQDLKGC
ncbi:uncharacterized protein C8Q71DRAFT_459518 [Rhodofomes roseus]|uniref:Uncharacterized protein n=1 Tax=Rhodofomes roseus TaxID=34475 RepID=A0ABQ8KMQ7_9APHY|nr:uncharacterized protein C8Q71DRAFT_459518 [Rhodofomes roseus]KAH9839702.1 hypothetical protein C8Q71DRAFT_459518 [Rhodofomes roseus]